MEEQIALSPNREKREMPFRSFNPEHQEILSKAHADFCAGGGIGPFSSEGDVAARIIVSLFHGGARTPEALKAAIAKTLRENDDE